MAKNDPLVEYREKRDFHESPEPSGRERTAGGSAPRFVIQKHEASTLHYDFRLEVGGVLKSWAVRKGPSTDPREKRLAMAAEDHPLAYAGFEGVIPSGYGAGAVIVWDRGTYRNLREDEGRSMEASLAQGKVAVWLDGEKLRGGYTLLRMKGREGWLLIKRADDEADPERNIVEDAPASVVSGRTVEEVRGERPPEPARPKPSRKRPSEPRKRGAPSHERSSGAPEKDEEPPRPVRIGRYTVEVTHPDRVLFPDLGLTKGDLADYYRRIAGRMLPYLRGRPLTLIRHPEGIHGEGFVQQHASPYYPAWIARATVEREEGGVVTHAVADNAATLAYLANQSVITPHVWLSRVDRPRHPDRMILDLDPPGDAFGPVRLAARAARDLLAELGLPAFVMTTGSSGLHVLTPLDRSADFDAVREFVRDLADELALRHPDALTVEQRKAKRDGCVFLDTLRNTYAHTAVPPYAVRARPGAPVATPLDWEELDDPALHAGRYTVENLFERLAEQEDPWAGLARRARGLTRARQRLDAVRKARH